MSFVKTHHTRLMDETSGKRLRSVSDGDENSPERKKQRINSPTQTELGNGAEDQVKDVNYSTEIKQNIGSESPQINNNKSPEKSMDVNSNTNVNDYSPKQQRKDRHSPIRQDEYSPRDGRRRRDYSPSFRDENERRRNYNEYSPTNRRDEYQTGRNQDYSPRRRNSGSYYSPTSSRGSRDDYSPSSRSNRNDYYYSSRNHSRRGDYSPIMNRRGSDRYDYSPPSRRDYEYSPYRREYSPSSSRGNNRRDYGEYSPPSRGGRRNYDYSPPPRGNNRRGGEYSPENKSRRKGRGGGRKRRNNRGKKHQNNNNSSPRGNIKNYKDKIPYFDEEDKKIREENHHLAQNCEKIKKLEKLERLLLEDASSRKYYARKGEIRTTNHWGQRKLLLSEIEFLTEYGEKSNIVVYAGAAPGAKNEYLASLFPKHKFIFVDPNPFHEKLITAANENPNIELINGFFTDDSALKYKDDHVLFISDIRTADNKVMDEEQVEETIVDDNRMQMSWHLKMEPAASMLKFRLPWGQGITKYLSGYSEEGKIYLPVWGRQSTTETRLVAVGNETYDYDNTKYEEQMFYFNTIERCHYYSHDIDVNEIPGLCHCYDCAAEIFILTQWAKKFPLEWSDTETPDDSEINECVTRMCKRLNKECAASGKRDLTVTIGHNQNWFTPKIFDPKTGVVIDVLDKEKLVVKSSTSDYHRKPRGYELNEDLLGGDDSTEAESNNDDNNIDNTES